MQPGDLRRFSDDVSNRRPLEGRTFMVLEVRTRAAAIRDVVDILIGGGRDTDLGYNWVRDSSELLEPV